MEGELPKQNLLQDNPQKKFSTGLLIIMNQKRFRLKNHNEKSEKIVSKKQIPKNPLLQSVNFNNKKKFQTFRS